MSQEPKALKDMSPEEVQRIAQLKTTDVQAAFAMVRDISVCDGLLLTQRFYDKCVEALNGDPDALKSYDPPPFIVPEMLSGFQYMSARCAAMRETFLDSKDETKCALQEQGISVVDLFCGLRVLRIRHPNADAKEMYGSMGNAMAMALKSRVGVPVDVAPLLEEAESTRRTLMIWHELVVRTSQISRILGKDTTKKSLVIAPAHVTQVRTKLLQSFVVQGMAELGVLISAVGVTTFDS